VKEEYTLPSGRWGDSTISELDRGVIYAPIKFAPPQVHILGRDVPGAPPTA
jgi:hypothetical protein